MEFRDELIAVCRAKPRFRYRVVDFVVQALELLWGHEVYNNDSSISFENR